MLHLSSLILYRSTVIMLIVVAVISILSTRFNALGDLWSLNNGFSVFWLFIMYYVGAFIRVHTPKGKKVWILIYFVCITVSFSCQIFVNYTGNLKSFIGDNLLSYNSPTIILAAVSLLLFFTKSNFSKASIKIISFIAPLSFSVYLISIILPVPLV